jgi:hypothetical protein
MSMAENPPESASEEGQLAIDIDKALTVVRIALLLSDTALVLTMCVEQLSDAIDEMNAHVNASSSKAQEAVLQRYREIYFDFKTEFKRTMVQRPTNAAGSRV